MTVVDGDVPEVSIHLITYQHARWLEEAIGGVLKQDIDDWELVIADDGSTDGTLEIAEAYRRRYPDRIRLMTRTNQGDRGRRTYAESLAMCRGAYVATLDGDDAWTDPSKLSRQIELLESRPDASAVVHALATVTDGRTVGRVGGRTARDYTVRDFIRGVHLPHSSMMVRGAFLDPFPDWWYQPRLFNADLAQLVLLAEYGPVVYVPEVLGIYRVHPHSQWSSLPKTCRIEHNMECRRVLREGMPGRFDREITRYLCLHAAILVVLHLLAGQLGRAGRALTEIHDLKNRKPCE